MKLVGVFPPVSFQRGISFCSSLWKKETSDWQVSSLKRTQNTLKWHEIFTKIKLKYLPKEQTHFWCCYWNSATSTFLFHIFSSCQKTEKGMRSIFKEFLLSLISFLLLENWEDSFTLKSAFLTSSEHCKDIVISGINLPKWKNLHWGLLCWAKPNYLWC